MRIKYTLLLTLGALASATAALANDKTELKFSFDSSALPANAHQELERVASRSFAHPDLKIVLDGSTDPIGTPEYNVGLSIRRAQAVRSELVSLGVDDSKIVMAAFGEDGARRASYADDRRVTVWTTNESLASIIDRTFAARGTAAKWNKPMTVAEINRSVPVASR